MLTGKRVFDFFTSSFFSFKHIKALDLILPIQYFSSRIDIKKIHKVSCHNQKESAF